tara:strand:+ start:765 stop:926 length:162 start_codon:yes stop_codon:yes gene_type:complete
MDHSDSKTNKDINNYKENIQFSKSPKYEDRVNLNASNIIQGVWDSIYEEKQAS